MGRYGVNNSWYGPMVTSCIGGLSQLPEVKMSWRKKSKKKLSNLNNIHFFIIFFRQSGPMVTRHIGGVSQDLVVK